MRLSLLHAVSAARISRETSGTQAAVRATVDVNGGISVTKPIASTRAEMLAQMQERVQALTSTTLSPDAKSVITATLLPTIQDQIAESINKEFITTQNLLEEAVKDLEQATQTAVTALGQATTADAKLSKCRAAQKESYVAAEKCVADREAALAANAKDCTEKTVAAASKEVEKKAAATVDLGASVCSPETCDVSADPTCGLGSLLTAVQGLQAEAELKSRAYTALVAEAAEAQAEAARVCRAADQYAAQDTCAEVKDAALEASRICASDNEAADLAKCSFGGDLQHKCADLTGVNALIAKIKAENRSDALSEPDRNSEWNTVQRLICTLEALRDDGDLSADAAQACADSEDRKYPNTFNYFSERIAAATSAESFTCTEKTVTFSGEVWSVGQTAQEFEKTSHSPAISLASDTFPFAFCDGQSQVLWKKTEGVYSGGYPANANGQGHDNTKYSLSDAKQACLANPNCKAVTCASGGTTVCTLRASEQLRKSPTAEDTYEAQLAVPEEPPMPAPQMWWTKAMGVYSGGYPMNANGAGHDNSVHNLAGAKTACLANPNCKAVTCASGGTTKCTLRASVELKKSPSGENTYKAVTVAEESWTKTTGVYSGGYPANIDGKGQDSARYSLADAKRACLVNPHCKAITCAGGNTESCTLRASETFKKSPSAEDTYAVA
mmetsp:Transcript_18202/g.43866  ORF Transcript_18202/g.43866 Transcript_18202/m.43866 type:complete len:672 (+) Transcript_18202:72-2087(+)